MRNVQGLSAALNQQLYQKQERIDRTEEKRFRNTCSRVPEKYFGPWPLVDTLNKSLRLATVAATMPLQSNPKGEVSVTFTLWKWDLDPIDYYKNKTTSVFFYQTGYTQKG